MDSMLPPDYALGQMPHAHQQQYVSQGVVNPQQAHYATYNDHTPSSGDAESPADLMSMHYASVSNENGKRPATGPAAVAESRKKARKTGDEESGVGDDAQNSPQGNGAGDGDGKVKSARGSRACTVCRRLKMKCVEVPGEACKRCAAGGYECRFEESNRGKRSTRKSEQFQRTLKKMERTIATVLQSISSSNPLSMGGFPQGLAASRSPSPPADHSPAESSPSSSIRPSTRFSPKLNTLPDNVINPLGLLAEASLSNSRPREQPADGAPRVGVASDAYFRPGPMTILPLRRLFIERQVQPEMLSFTTTDEVVALFNIFFDHMNHHATVLEREFHTPSLVCSRSPFLLTSICAVASKFYPENPTLHPRLEALARKLAFTVVERGYKSTEIVQGYLILALWGTGPTERYEQDRTFMMIGMAIRMALDLNLHRKSRTTFPVGSVQDKEARNRERTWIMCFIVDRSSSGQLGKPYTVTDESMIRSLTQWCQHPSTIPNDYGLAAYAEMQRILSRSLEFLYAGYNSPADVQADCDYLLVVKTIEAQFMNWRQEWEETAKSVVGGRADYRDAMGKFYFHYVLLIINSFGLQNALERSGVDMGHFFGRCHFSATSLLTVVRDELVPSGVLKYSVDAHFVQISYAVLTLMKLLRPEFRSFFESEDSTIALIKSAPDLLESVAAGTLHTPALYATFLRALIAAKFDGATTNASAITAAESAAPVPIAPAVHDLQHHQHAQQPQQSHPSHLQQHLQHPIEHIQQAHQLDYTALMPDFQFMGEMGPVADLSTFPPTMADTMQIFGHDSNQLLTMDSILGDGTFWDNVLVPGYSGSMEGLSGGFVHGAYGSGLITPRVGGSPMASGVNTPTGEGHYSYHVAGVPGNT